MAAKTITIDMEAYERLASLKRAGESFSQVIKELTRRSPRTASALLADAADIRLHDATLETISTIVSERNNEFPRIAHLGETG